MKDELPQSKPEERRKILKHVNAQWDSRASSALKQIMQRGGTTASAVVDSVTSRSTGLCSSMKLSSHRYFDNMIGILICVNAITLAIETDHGDPHGVIYVFENIVCVVFLAEMGLKIFENRLKYFTCPWQLFDFFLVWYTVVDLWFLGSDAVNLSCLRMLRILRLARIFKVLRNFKELWLILSGILHSLKVIFWVSLLLILIVFVVSIAVTEMVGHEKNLYLGYNEDPDETEVVAEWNNYEYFGTISRSMMTLFNIGVLAEWPEITRPVFHKQPYVLLLLFCYLALVFFGIMNAIIGVIVEGMMDTVKQHNDNQAKRMRQDKHAINEALAEVIQEFDADKDGHISESELALMFHQPRIKEVLSHIPDLEAKTGYAPDLLALFDGNGTGKVSYEEFLRGMYHLIENPGDWKFCELKIATHSLKQMVRKGFVTLTEHSACQSLFTGESPKNSPFPERSSIGLQGTCPFQFSTDPITKVGKIVVQEESVVDPSIRWPDSNGCQNHSSRCELEQPPKGVEVAAQGTPELQSTLVAIQGSISTLNLAVARLAAQQTRAEAGVNSLRDEIAEIRSKVDCGQVPKLLEGTTYLQASPGMLLS